jgi:hypothetical protein
MQQSAAIGVSGDTSDTQLGGCKMAHSYHHAVNSARKYGGKPEDYIGVHSWFDETKEHYADFRHRALRHHSLGIFEAEQKFGITITNSDGKQIPVRIIGEQHVKEDCGYIPTVQDWLKHIQGQKWMSSPPVRLERELVKTQAAVEV